MNCFSLRLLCGAIFFLVAGGNACWAHEGFAGNVSGGGDGAVVTVKTTEEFCAKAQTPEPLVIRVEGTLNIGSVAPASNKTIVGIGERPTLVGQLFLGGGVENIILKNLFITYPMNKKGKGGGDGVTVRGAKRVWIDHCTFVDCGDGCVDVTEGADFVTVSWCKFYYTNQPEHRFTMLAMGRDKDRKKKKVKNKLNITLHHNWWADNCGSRMPAMRKAEVHMYNNYFSCSGNAYCTNARPDTELLSENNYYEKVQNPLYAEKNVRMKTVDNIFDDCTGKAERRDDKVFKPPYPYSLDKTRKVPDIVRRGAGANSSSRQ